jgi:hypothetical protein
MRKLLSALTFLILASVPAQPQFLTPGIVIAGSSPTTCSTPALKFCLAANSMYIAIGVF